MWCYPLAGSTTPNRGRLGAARHPMNRTAIRHETREAGLILHNSITDHDLMQCYPLAMHEIIVQDSEKDFKCFGVSGNE